MSLLFSLLVGGQGLSPGDTPSFNGVLTSKNIGTVASGSSVVEYGDGYNHTSVITVNTTLGNIPGGAALGLGKLLYTLPAGAVLVGISYISLAVTQTTGNINANTPQVGLGTTVASGAVSVLTGTPAFINVMPNQTAANCTGTATVNTAHINTDINSADDHTIYANFAAAWAAGGDPAALLTGTVVLNWQFLA